MGVIRGKGFVFRYLVIIPFSVLGLFILVPLVVFLSKLPPFIYFYFYSVAVATPVAIILVAIGIFLILKLLLKQSKLGFMGVGLFIVLVVVASIFGKFKQDKLSQQLHQEIVTKSTVADKTRIEITSFRYTPTFNSNGVVTQMKFDLSFTSNQTADIGIYPHVSLIADHYLSNSPFRFRLKTKDTLYGDLMRDMHGSDTVFLGTNTVQFEVNNFMEDITKYIVGDNGQFEVRVGFNINISDPYGYGQGNVTTITNVADKSGLAVLDTSDNQLGNIYLTQSYKVRE